MSVIGNYSQGASGNIETELGGETAATGGNLGSPDTYSHLDVSGTAVLNGTFEVSLTNGFAPQLGDVFSVFNYGAYAGQFTNYLGLRISSNLVLAPTLTSNALILTATTVSAGTTAPLQPVTSGSSIPVASGSTYAGIISTSPLSSGNGTVATVLGGTATSSTSVSISFQPAGNFAASSGGPLVSDIVNFQGTGTNTFVLQIDYNEAALAAGENEQDIFLAWLNPGTDTWENAVLGNTGNSVPNQIIGAYNPATDFVLGDYGVDPVDGRVWAVVNHNSAFGAAAVGTASVPEPGTWGMVGLGVAGIAVGRRRSRKRLRNGECGMGGNNFEEVQVVHG
jgi:hypothetical protein